jgi:hypothetical protein
MTRAPRPARQPDMLEQDILPDVLVAVTALPQTLAWRANSGLFLSMDGKRHVRANIPGCADVLGCQAVTITPEMVGMTIGRAVAIETKRRTGKQQETQDRFERLWTAAGGVYIIARSAEQAVADLTAAIP